MSLIVETYSRADIGSALEESKDEKLNRSDLKYSQSVICKH